MFPVGKVENRSSLYRKMAHWSNRDGGVNGPAHHGEWKGWFELTDQGGGSELWVRVEYASLNAEGRESTPALLCHHSD
jgi:hypothetical protein